MNHLDHQSVVLEDAWLRRVARALIRDSHTAEDLAQDAWLAGLSRGRSGPKDRPWLGGVLRNRAFAELRRRTARRDREEQAARPEATDGADDVAEQLQLRECVARELAALGEPHRSALYLRFVEGLTLRKLAARWEVAPSTAQKRVHEGLEQLRLRLDREYGGDRRAWAALVLPWSQAASFGGVGSLLMVLVVVAGVVAGSAAALHGLWQQPSISVPRASSVVALEPNASEPAPVGEAVTTASAAAGSGATGGANGRVAMSSPNPLSAGTTSQVADRRSHLSARALLPNGEPAAGAVWTLKGRRRRLDLEGDYLSAEAPPELTGQVDSDGWVEVDVMGTPSVRYTLTIDHPSCAVAMRQIDNLGRNEIKSLGEVDLCARGRVVGRVVGADSEPLVCREWRVTASVRGSRQDWVAVGGSAETDDTATFRLDRVPVGMVDLSIMDHAVGRIEGPTEEVLAGQTVEVDFPLPEFEPYRNAITVSCSVLPTTMVPQPLPNQVWLVDEDGERRAAEAMPGKRNVYLFRDVGAGAFRCEVDLPHLGSRSWEGLHAGQHLRVGVMGEARIQLTVIGPDGEPADVTAATVRLTADGLQPMERRIRRSGSTLKDGMIWGLIPGDYTLVVESANGRGTIDVPQLQQGELRPLTLVLQLAAGVSGRVVGPGGAPVAGELVRVVEPAAVDDSPFRVVLTPNVTVSSPEQHRRLVARCETDADGRFAVRTHGEHPFPVMAGGYPGPQTESPVMDPAAMGAGAPLQLVLQAPAQISGKIQVPEGANVGHWRVCFHGAEELDYLIRARADVGDDGSFALPQVAPGTGTLILTTSRFGHGRPPTPPGQLPNGDYWLGTVSVAPGEAFYAKYNDVDFDSVPVQFAIAGLPPETGWVEVHAAERSSGFSDWKASKGAEVGPLRLKTGVYTVWTTGDGWAARTSDVSVMGLGGQPLALPVALSTRKVRIVADGEPLAEVFLTLGIPDELNWTNPTTDELGFVELTLGSGSYQMISISADLDLVHGSKIGSFSWPLPPGVEEIELGDW